MALSRFITTIDSHTAGHPTRVVTGGLPILRGESAAARQVDFAAHHDYIRTMLLHEPRGHAAMVGAVPLPSSQADFGAIFLSTYKYLEMCGHATIGLAVTLDHMGVLPGGRECSRFTLEVPAGVVTVRLEREGGRLVGVELENLPAYVAARGVTVRHRDSELRLDIAYGGNWYALVSAEAADIDLSPAGVGAAMAAGASIKAQVNALIEAGAVGGIDRPIDSVLFHQLSSDAEGLINRQLVVLESNKFDRSPCGTGTSARLAQLVADGVVQRGQVIRSRNILDVDFLAHAAPDDATGAKVLPVIRGMAHITGMHSFVLDDSDPLPNGFICR